jgi:histidine ammonia-lyase
VNVVLDGLGLTIGDVTRVARHGEAVAPAPRALARMRRARDLVEEALQEGRSVYGLTTGVGALKRTHIDPAGEVAFNRRLIRTHLVGQGAHAPHDVVRAQALRLANFFLSGDPGVRPELAVRLIRLLNDDCLPDVHTLGSLGQSDLAPNADLAHSLFDGFDPAAGETLATLNNNAFATGWAALALADARRLVDAVEAGGALALEAFAANLSMLHPAIARRRPYRGLQTSLDRLRTLLEGSFLWQEGAARNLQDPLTIRNLVQLQGAARDALDHALDQLAVELNAAQGNPLVVLPEEFGGEPVGEKPGPISAGAYEVLPLAAALDYVRLTFASMLTSAHERSLKLLDTPWSGLPTGLVPKPGTPESGLSHYAIAGEALVAEARLLGHPVSFELASSAGAEGIEDRATMAPLAARQLAQQVELGERIVAIGLLVAAQAVELRGATPLGRGTSHLLGLVRERLPFMGADDAMPSDVEPLFQLVRSGALSGLP